MNTVLNIKVGDWVVDNRGDFGRVCRLVFEADLERLQHLKVFSFWSNLPDEMTQTTQAALEVTASDGITTNFGPEQFFHGDTISHDGFLIDNSALCIIRSITNMI